MKLFIVLALAVVSVSDASVDTVFQYGFPEGRIINGQDALVGEAPYILSLQYRGNHFCAAILIHERWCLTAAHCMEVYSTIEAVAGLHLLSDKSNAQIRLVTQQIRHNKYRGNVGPNDIGLANVEAFALNGGVNTISLPLTVHQDTGDGQIFGWGVTSSGGLSKTLQTLKVKILGYLQCLLHLPPLSPFAPSNICIIDDGACRGDSGGPLMRTIDNRKTVVGIVSWGTLPCGGNSSVSVFVRVSHFIHWIKEQISN